MSVPALQKTWQHDVNNEYTGNVDTMRRNILRKIKDTLIGWSSSPWSVYYSCDGVTAGTAGDATDRWVDNGDLVWATGASPHSWMVLKSTTLVGPSSNFQLLIDLNYGYTYQANISFSPNAGYTGGSTTVAPTATDQSTVRPSNTNAWWVGGQGNPADLTKMILNIMGSTDGECTRVLILDQDSQTIACWIIDQLDNAASYPATGQIQCVTKAELLDDETFVISDGEGNVVTFYFQVTGGASGPGTVVDVQTDTTADEVKARIISAINGLSVTALRVTASDGGTGLVDLTADFGGTQANITITETVADADFVVTGMTGGAGLRYPVIVGAFAQAESASRHEMMTYDRWVDGSAWTYGGNAFVIRTPGGVTHSGRLTAETVGPLTLLGEFFTFPGDFNGKYPIVPLGAAGTGGSRGRWGTLYDLFGGSTAVNTGNSYPPDGSFQFIQFGDFIFPWDGSLPVVK